MAAILCQPRCLYARYYDDPIAESSLAKLAGKKQAGINLNGITHPDLHASVLLH